MISLPASVSDFLDHGILGIPVLRWAWFLGIIVGVYLILRVVVGVVLSRLRTTVERTENTYDDYVVGMLGRTRWFGYLGLAIFLSLQFVDLRGPTTSAEESFRSLALVMFFIQLGFWGTGLVDVILEKGFRAARVSEATIKTSSGVVRWFVLVFIWACVFLLVLTAFHIQITPLLAGLGVGGIAIAFALQQILSDVFCSVAIVLDRPFEVGDFIIIGDFMGSVERIGIKTTRLRSLGGEQIIIPNSDLLGSRVRNYKRMEERRIVFGFGVLYSTPMEKLERIPEVVKEIINGIEDTRFDRAHLLSFGESALQYEVVYHVLSADYNKYMDIQQKINFSLFRWLKADNVGMAFPSRTLYLDRESAELIKGTANQRPERSEA